MHTPLKNHCIPFARWLLLSESGREGGREGGGGEGRRGEGVGGEAKKGGGRR